MTIGPEPMSNIVLISSRFGIVSLQNMDGRSIQKFRIKKFAYYSQWALKI
jgi:hypothetical protein